METPAEEKEYQDNQYEDKMDELVFTGNSNNKKNNKKRCRKISSKRRKRLKDKYQCDEYVSFFNEQLSSCGPDFSASHPLYFISEREFRYMKENTILLKNPRIQFEKKKNRTIHYEIASIGKNLVLEKSQNSYNYINLKRTKRNCFYIMINHSELNDILKLDLKKCGPIIHDHRNYKKILLLQCQDYSGNVRDMKYELSSEDIDIIKKSSHNQIRSQGKKHHGSLGVIYSYGYVAKYDSIKENNLSFGKYTSKLHKNSKLQKMFNNDNQKIEGKLFSIIFHGIKQLSKKNPNIICMISPKIQKVQSIFDLLDDESLQEQKVMFDYGMINAHLCINAMTAQAHTEMDSSYTVITVPKQIDKNYNTLGTRFVFEINNKMNINIKMTENVTFIYSGYLLTHHQIHNHSRSNSAMFLNLASYGNKRLFHNMMKSLRRDLNLKDGI